jgi:hypothetical protein
VAEVTDAARRPEKKASHHPVEDTLMGSGTLDMVNLGRLEPQPMRRRALKCGYCS